MITVVDYGMGNLRSVSKALEHLGGRVRVSSKWQEIEKAEKLVLPGVGAFGDAVRELHYLRLFEPIKRYLETKRPFLGICLGLQLLFAESEEDPTTIGLSHFPGKVIAFRSSQDKIPHMGWNNVSFNRQHPFLKGLNRDPYFYFVHSYYAQPDNPAISLAGCQYGNATFPAILGQGWQVATQFHPEKSQKAGLTLLKNFIEC